MSLDQITIQLFDDEFINFVAFLGITIIVSFGLGMLAKKFTDKVDS
jgi:hypothetical protein